MEIKKKEGHGPPPAVKKFMHPRNPYKTPPSFKKLAIDYPEFRQYCTYDIGGRVHLDFKNPEALSSLTTSLLNQDFGLKVNIPSNRLVPTLPLRLNYLLWIEDLLTIAYKKSPNSLSSCSITGFDVGTGAACIYPLLGVKKFSWNFIATEKDEDSYQCAKANICYNGFASKILIKKTTDFFNIIKEEDTANFLKKVKEKYQHSEMTIENNEKLKKNSENENKMALNMEYLIDFTICNPPFFCNEEEMNTKGKSKKDTRSEPVSSPTGSNHEKIYEGGEVAFIKKMIEMSEKYKNSIRIFSSMIGNQKNVKTIKKLVQEIGPAHMSSSEFCQGRTMRWGIAWTFDPTIRLEQVLSKKQMCSSKPLTLLIPRTLMSQYSVLAAWKKVEAWLKILKLKPHIIKKNNYFVSVIIKAYKETWLHQRKKKRELTKNSTQSPLKDGKNGAELMTTTQDSTDKEDNNKRRIDALNEDNSLVKNDTTTTKKFKDNDSFIGSERSETEKREISVNVESLNLIEGPNSMCDTIDSSSHSQNGGASQPPSNDELNPESCEELISNQTSCSDNGLNKTKKHLDCLLRCSINIKQTNALLSLELSLLGGTKGKDAMNQLLQYMKNRLQNGE